MTKKYYKIVDDKYVWYKNYVVLNNRTIFNPSEEQILEAGYQEYIPEPIPEPTPEEIERRELINEMNNLKQQLSLEDYKIIKCSEAFIIGEVLPYDIEELISSRNEKRGRINEIESLLK